MPGPTRVASQITAGVAGFVLGTLSLAGYVESRFVALIPETKQQHLLIETGAASKDAFTRAAQTAVDQKTKELLEANRELIKGIGEKKAVGFPTP